MTKGCVHHHDYEQGKAVPLKMDEIFEKFQGGAVIFLSVLYVANFPLYKNAGEKLSQKSAKKWGGGGSVTVSDFSKTFHLFYG